jgi:hypothetical protein
MPKMSGYGLVRVETLLLKWCVVRVITDNKHKFTQFVTIFWFLKLDQPLIDLEKMK